MKNLLTFRVHDVIIRVYTKRGGEMSPRTGRPKSENPKDIQLKIRADKQTVEDLEYCCQKTSLTKSDVIRLGIQKVKDEVDKKE